MPKEMTSPSESTELREILENLVDDERGKHFLDVPYVEHEIKALLAQEYSRGVEDALKALELHPSTLVGRDPTGGEQDERVAIYNLALTKAHQNIEKLKVPKSVGLKEPSND